MIVTFKKKSEDRRNPLSGETFEIEIDENSEVFKTFLSNIFLHDVKFKKTSGVTWIRYEVSADSVATIMGDKAYLVTEKKCILFVSWETEDKPKHVYIRYKLK